MPYIFVPFCMRQTFLKFSGILWNDRQAIFLCGVCVTAIVDIIITSSFSLRNNNNHHRRLDENIKKGERFCCAWISDWDDKSNTVEKRGKNKSNRTILQTKPPLHYLYFGLCKQDRVTRILTTTTTTYHLHQIASIFTE